MPAISAAASAYSSFFDSLAAAVFGIFKALAYSTETPFSDLPTLALERLANTLSKHAELMYVRLFGRHLSECRLLAIVASREPTSLSEVCEQLDLDKGHASRQVSKLVSAGLQNATAFGSALWAKTTRLHSSLPLKR